MLVSDNHPVAIKDEGLVIESQFLIRSASRPCPAHPHVTSSERLKLKIPLPCLHSVGLLHTEETDGFNAILYMVSS